MPIRMLTEAEFKQTIRSHALPHCLLCGGLFNCKDLIDRLLYEMQTKEDMLHLPWSAFHSKSGLSSPYSTIKLQQQKTKHCGNIAYVTI